MKKNFRMLYISKHVIVVISSLLVLCTAKKTIKPPALSNNLINKCGTGKLINTLANTAREVGVISDCYTEGKNGEVILIGETHNSLVGQVEIAIMLLRLNRDYKFNEIALEGTLYDDTIIAQSWMHELKNDILKQEIALGLLGKGEVSAPEFALFAFQGTKVYGIEDSSEYFFKAGNAGDTSAYLYLYRIGNELFPDDQDLRKLKEDLETRFREAASDTIKNLVSRQYSKLIINANDWTKSKYQTINSDSIIAIEEILSTLLSIREKAVELKIEDEENSKSLDELIQYYEMASTRTMTMLKNVLLINKGAKNTPIILVMGAGHCSKASEFLKEKGYSYITILPTSLINGNANKAVLTQEALARKRNNLSVDSINFLGSLLDNRWKPPMTVSQKWFQYKAKIIYIAYLLADYVRRNKGKPIPPELWSEIDKQSTEFSIPHNSVEILGAEVLLKVEFGKGNEHLWIRSITTKNNLIEISLEEKLLRLRSELIRDKQPQQVPKREGLIVDNIFKSFYFTASRKHSVLTRKGIME